MLRHAEHWLCAHTPGSAWSLLLHRPDSYRSVERALRNEHLRISLENYTARTVPALDIGAYADTVYQANRVAGL
jgi:hypothetical protein